MPPGPTSSDQFLNSKSTGKSLQRENYFVDSQKVEGVMTGGIAGSSEEIESVATGMEGVDGSDVSKRIAKFEKLSNAPTLL